MVQRIDKDVGRFREIVRGKIKQNLRKYLSNGEMIGRKGKELVSIPIPQLDIPHFRYGDKGNGGVSSGEGQEGTPLDTGDEEGSGKAGNSPGGHMLEVDVSLDELADILGDELALPRIKPKGADKLIQEKDR